MARPNDPVQNKHVTEPQEHLTSWCWTGGQAGIRFAKLCSVRLPRQTSVRLSLLSANFTDSITLFVSAKEMQESGYLALHIFLAGISSKIIGFSKLRDKSEHTLISKRFALFSLIIYPNLSLLFSHPSTPKNTCN